MFLRGADNVLTVYLYIDKDNMRNLWIKLLAELYFKFPNNKKLEMYFWEVYTAKYFKIKCRIRMLNSCTLEGVFPDAPDWRIR